MSSAEMASEEVWMETKGIVKDVEKLCSGPEDVQRVERCKELGLAIREEFAMCEASAAELIKLCTKKVEEAEVNADELAAQTPTSPEIEALENEQRAIENRIREQRHDKTQAEASIVELEAKVARLEAELDAARATAQARAPVIMHQIGLFANVSKIKWDFEQEDPAVVAGTIADASSGRVQSFSINTRDTSPFQTANQLWELIGASN